MPELSKDKSVLYAVNGCHYYPSIKVSYALAMAHNHELAFDDCDSEKGTSGSPLYCNQKTDGGQKTSHVLFGLRTGAMDPQSRRDVNFSDGTANMAVTANTLAKAVLACMRKHGLKQSEH